MLLTVLFSIAAAGGAYAVAKKKRTNTGSAAALGLAAGAGTGAAITLFAATWPLLFLFGFPAAAVYYYGKAKGQKAIGPGR